MWKRWTGRGRATWAFSAKFLAGERLRAALSPEPDIKETPVSDPNDAIQSLSRIAAAAARLMAHMHHAGKATDPNEEIGHMRANLNHVAEQVTKYG